LSPDNSAPVLLAETLLHEWETSTRSTQSPAYLAARPRVSALLAEFSKSLLIDAPINVDAEDVRSVLRRATTIGLGTAVAHGPGRAGHAAALVIATVQAQQLGPEPTGSAVSSLLCITSGPDCELEMDELTEITETVQTTFGQDMEMIFGHDILPDLTGSALQVWLLVGYAAAMATAVPASSTSPRV
jgi:cell division GTPase FtsZ